VSAAAVLDAPQSSTSPLLATEDAAQDAGAGKIRGPNGRFMPKEQSRKSTGDGRGKPAIECKYTRLIHLWYLDVLLTLHSENF
jgi:hypothetical protein